MCICTSVCVFVWVCVKPTLRNKPLLCGVCNPDCCVHCKISCWVASRFKKRCTSSSAAQQQVGGGVHMNHAPKKHQSSHHHPNLIRLIMLRSITNCAFLKKKHENTSVSNRSTDEVLGIPGIIFFTMSLTLWPTKNPPGETSECPAKMLHWAQGPTRLGGGDDKPGWLGAAAGGNPTVHYGAIFIHIFGQNIFKGAMELNIMSCYWCLYELICIILYHYVQKSEGPSLKGNRECWNVLEGMFMFRASWLLSSSLAHWIVVRWSAFLVVVSTQRCAYVKPFVWDILVTALCSQPTRFS